MPTITSSADRHVNPEGGDPPGLVGVQLAGGLHPLTLTPHDPTGWTLQQLEGSVSQGQQLIQRASSYLAYARANPGPYQLIMSRLLDNDHRFADIVALRQRAIGGVISLIISASDPVIDQQTAKFRGVSMWSMLYGHLILDNELQQPIDSQTALDGAVARLATRMALLTVES